MICSSLGNIDMLATSKIRKFSPSFGDKSPKKFIGKYG
jgi:hypothetical protein